MYRPRSSPDRSRGLSDGEGRLDVMRGVFCGRAVMHVEQRLGEEAVGKSRRGGVDFLVRVTRYHGSLGSTHSCPHNNKIKIRKRIFVKFQSFSIHNNNLMGI